MIIRNNENIIISGNAGCDSEIKQGKKGTFSRFSVNANDTWFSISAPANVQHVSKGDKVCVIGKYEHAKNQYHNIYADIVITNDNGNTNTANSKNTGELQF